MVAEQRQALIIKPLGLVIDIFPFLMRLEDAHQPIERARDERRQNEIGQSPRTPAVERRKKDGFGSFHGSRVILT